MYGFTTSELETVLIGLGVKRVAELTAHDTIRAMRLLLTERVPDSRSRMHVDPIDFDDRRVDGVFDLLADVTTARLKGRNTELPALYERIVDVLLAVITDRLQDKVTQAWQETLSKRRQAMYVPYQAREDDPHAQEIADDMRVERARENERMRDFVEELAVRA